ncbi:hypothetical protein FKV25_01865 [Lysobacter aestuarii]|uniref:Uncharacterized protein n=2 Tax=Marilutibacter aestuarii TaxID=1706195 RepID=A0A508AQJ6_9GAMM|nr:hypothetical protein FKV25_01865 [Lysobacter aestuarii]
MKRAFEHLNKRVQALEEGARRSHARLTLPRSDAWDQLERHQEREVHYANVILLLGYGGFFALWTTVAGKMPAWLFGLSGLMIAFSLLLFISFELAKTAVSSASLTRSKKLGLTANQAIDRSNLAVDVINGWQPWIFYPAVITGLGAGLIVLGFFGFTLFSEAYSAASPEDAPPAAEIARP